MGTEKSTVNGSGNSFGVSSLSRRATICGLAAILLGVNPRTAEAAKGISINAKGQIVVLLSENPALKKVGGVIKVDLRSGMTVAVTRTSNSTTGFTAINLSCTHEGITVMQVGSKWVCPAHQSSFSLVGKVMKGPATSNLQKLKVIATAKSLTITV